MSVQTSWRIAVKSLRRNKLQTILTMTGMTIGVATVLTMIALGSGAQASIQDQVRAAGMNLIVVEGGNWNRGNTQKGVGNMSRDQSPTFMQLPAAPHLILTDWNVSAAPRLLRIQGDSEGSGSMGLLAPATGRPGDALEGHGAAVTLVDADVAAIRKVKGVQYASGGMHDTLSIMQGDTRLVTSMRGDDTVLPKIRRGWNFPFGRFYNSSEEKQGANVVVLGQFVAQQFYGATDPVGQFLNLKGEDFKVLGVIGSNSWMVRPAAGDDQFDAVYVPVSTLHRLMQQDYLNRVTVTTESTGAVLQVEDSIKTLLRQRHHIGDNDVDDFTVKGEGHKTLAHGMSPEAASAVMGNAAGLDKLTLDQLSKTLDQASSTMAALLTSIAAVSLIVGGIGVMNIMLLSVSQRTREIGIRRAIGARSQDVLTQFLLEATTLSLAGGFLGILLGCLASIAIARTAQWSTSISTPAIVISFTVSAAVGIFFGYYPARQASQILPINALRHE